MLHEHLQELSTSQLELVAAQASIKLTSKQKRHVVLRLASEMSDPCLLVSSDKL